MLTFPVWRDSTIVFRITRLPILQNLASSAVSFCPFVVLRSAVLRFHSKGNIVTKSSTIKNCMGTDHVSKPDLFSMIRELVI